MIHENAQPTRRLPAWVAGLAVLLLLAGSAWALYKLVFHEKPSTGVEAVTIAPPGRGWGGGGGPGFNGRGGPARMDVQPNSVASVSRQPTGRIRARHGSVYVYGIPRQSGGGFDSILEYDSASSWVTKKQWDDQIFAGRPAQYAALAEKIGFTADQKQKIAALTYQPALSDAEKKDFDRLFTNWLNAPPTEKDPAAEELTRTVESVGTKHLAEAKALLLKRCNEVVTILSEEQMQGIRDWFGSPNPRTPAPRQGPGRLQPRTGTAGPLRAPSTLPVRAPTTAPTK